MIKEALAVARKYAVFPVGSNKVPCWSKEDLVSIGFLKAGEKAGYHASTKHPDTIRKLFKHGGAVAIGVPCRPNGIVVVDVDLYKDGVDVWLEENKHWLEGTLTHSTPGGGLHFIFEDPGGRLPGALAPGVELKVNGFINWPGAAGYEVKMKATILPFPPELLHKKGNGASRPTSAGQGEAVSTQELERRVKTGEELYPALRALSWRWAQEDNPADYIQGALMALMHESDASSVSHDRHEDWKQRYEKLGDLASSAVEKAHAPELDEETISKWGKLSEEQPLFKAEAPAPARPAPDLWNPEMQVGDLKPREWTLGTIIPSGQLTVLSAMGGTGKSMLSMIMATSITTGQDLLGKVPLRHAVWLINNEDERDELDRRLVGIRDHFDLKGAGPLDTYLTGAPVTGDAEFFELGAMVDGEVVINRDAIDYLERGIVSRELGLLCLDPFITLIRGAAINDNNAVYAIARELRKLAQRTGCAILIIHHNRKGSTDGSNAENMMGAASLGNAARSVLMASPINKKLLVEMGLGKEAQEEAVLKYFSLTNAKQNRSRKTAAVWFEMMSHDLGNGDQVGIPVLVGTVADLRLRIASEGSLDISMIKVVDEVLKKVEPGTYNSLPEVFVTPFDEPVLKFKGGFAKRVREAFAKPVLGLKGGSIQIVKDKRGRGGYRVIVEGPEEET